MKPLPKLALQAVSIDDFVTLAGQAGHLVKDEDILLEHLKEEWLKYRLYIFLRKDYSHLPLPNQLPHLETEKDGITYTVFGIVHEQEPSQPYLHIVKNTAPALAGLWEQNVMKHFAHLQGIEIPDHYVKKQRDLRLVNSSFWDGFTDGIVLPLLPLFIPQIREKRRVEKEKKEKKETMLTALEAITLSEPFAIIPFAELPIHLHLELAERVRPTSYSPYQRRSAYMAEFLKAWDNRAPRKTITVGAGHVLEIIHFLEKGTKDQQIVDLAWGDAELLNSDPLEFHHFYRRYKTKERLLGSIAIGSGFLTPYALLAKWLFF
ncbi:hypothetical protein J4210_04580 [Candidatus Woesearchaeota archaeon]|nr:hypothetical protein [Candidatus Woesearchaeota archaeon]